METIHPCAELMRQHDDNPIYQAYLRDQKIGSPVFQDRPTWKMYAQFQIELHNLIGAARHHLCSTKST